MRIDAIKADCVTDEQAKEVANPEDVLESLKNRIGNDPRLCSRVG